MRILRTALATLILAWFAPSAHAADKVKVVASFSIVADLVRQVGGDRVEVTSLVGPNTDMHVFQPTPADAKKLLDANLVVVNGLGLEGWADRLVKASGYKGPTVVASKGVKALAAADDGHRQSQGGKGHARNDPHAWQDVGNIKIYVANIRDELAGVDAGGKATYDDAAARYLKSLDDLEREIRDAYATVPKDRRRVITSHDAFAYYGKAYGVDFLAPQGVGGDTEPTAKDVAALIRQIKRENVKAVFVENISNPRLIERIAKEAGVRLGGTLYSDALSEAGSPAATYTDMMRHNTKLLSDAMK
jgi:zinc/manganese transport system substrate-binding protein